MVIEKDKFHNLAEMMFEPGNYKLWNSYLHKSFTTKGDLGLKEAMEPISRERDLLNGENSSYSNADKVTRLAASIESRFD